MIFFLFNDFERVTILFEMSSSSVKPNVYHVDFISEKFLNAEYLIKKGLFRFGDLYSTYNINEPSLDLSQNI